MLWRIIWTTTLGFGVLAMITGKLGLNSGNGPVFQGVFGVLFLASWFGAIVFQWHLYRHS